MLEVIETCNPSAFSSTHFALLSPSQKDNTFVTEACGGNLQVTALTLKQVEEGATDVIVLTLPKAEGNSPRTENQRVQTSSAGVILHSSKDLSVLADASEIVSACGRQTKPKVYGGFSDFQFVSFTDLSLQTVWIILWPKREASCFQASLSITSSYSLEPRRGEKNHWKNPKQTCFLLSEASTVTLFCLKKAVSLFPRQMATAQQGGLPAAAEI